MLDEPFRRWAFQLMKSHTDPVYLAIEVEAPRAVDEQLDLGAAEWKRFVGLGVKELSGRHAG